MVDDWFGDPYQDNLIEAVRRSSKVYHCFDEEVQAWILQ